MPSAFITGITGQDGWYLASRLVAAGYSVHGIARREAAVPVGARLHQADVRDASTLRAVLELSRPDEVYHLAAESSVERSWEAPERARQEHRDGLHAVLRAVLDLSPEARIVVASSSEIFARSPTVPQDERTVLAPASPYGAGKVAALELLRAVRDETGAHVSAAILYNHESRRRPLRFLSRKVTAGAAAIALGRATSLQLGNLESRRDWGYAPDYVDAMCRMAQHTRGDDYVIGTGVSRTVRELCEVAFRAAKLDYEDHVVSDPSLIRDADPVTLVADSGHARRVLGWSPTIPFEAMIAAMVTADIARLRAGEPC